MKEYQITNTQHYAINIQETLNGEVHVQLLDPSRRVELKNIPVFLIGQNESDKTTYSFQELFKRAAFSIHAGNSKHGFSIQSHKGTNVLIMGPGAMGLMGGVFDQDTDKWFGAALGGAGIVAGFALGGPLGLVAAGAVSGGGFGLWGYAANTPPEQYNHNDSLYQMAKGAGVGAAGGALGPAANIGGQMVGAGSNVVTTATNCVIASMTSTVTEEVIANVAGEQRPENHPSLGKRLATSAVAGAAGGALAGGANNLMQNVYVDQIENGVDAFINGAIKKVPESVANAVGSTATTNALNGEELTKGMSQSAGIAAFGGIIAGGTQGVVTHNQQPEPAPKPTPPKPAAPKPTQPKAAAPKLPSPLDLGGKKAIEGVIAGGCNKHGGTKIDVNHVIEQIEHGHHVTLKGKMLPGLRGTGTNKISVNGQELEMHWNAGKGKVSFKLTGQRPPVPAAPPPVAPPPAPEIVVRQELPPSVPVAHINPKPAAPPPVQPQPPVQVQAGQAKAAAPKAQPKPAAPKAEPKPAAPKAEPKPMAPKAAPKVAPPVEERPPTPPMPAEEVVANLDSELPELKPLDEKEAEQRSQSPALVDHNRVQQLFGANLKPLIDKVDAAKTTGETIENQLTQAQTDFEQEKLSITKEISELLVNGFSLIEKQRIVIASGHNIDLSPHVDAVLGGKTLFFQKTDFSTGFKTTQKVEIKRPNAKLLSLRINELKLKLEESKQTYIQCAQALREAIYPPQLSAIDRTQRPGNCLFDNVVAQLHPNATDELINQEGIQLRARVVEYMRVHQDEFIAFFNHDADEQYFLAGDGAQAYAVNNWNQYLQAISYDTVWADQLVLQAVAQVLDSPVVNLIPGDPVLTNHNCYNPDAPGAPIFMAHIANVHFQALIPPVGTSARDVYNQLRAE